MDTEGSCARSGADGTAPPPQSQSRLLKGKCVHCVMFFRRSLQAGRTPKAPSARVRFCKRLARNGRKPEGASFLDALSLKPRPRSASPGLATPLQPLQPLQPLPLSETDSRPSVVDDGELLFPPRQAAEHSA